MKKLAEISFANISLDKMQWLFNRQNQLSWFIYISSLFVLLNDIFAIGICSVVFVVLHIKVQYNCIHLYKLLYIYIYK